MATHSSILTWETPWTEEPSGLPSMGSQGDTTEPTAHQGGTRVGRRHEESGPGWPDPCPPLTALLLWGLSAPSLGHVPTCA